MKMHPFYPETPSYAPEQLARAEQLQAEWNMLEHPEPGISDWRSLGMEHYFWLSHRKNGSEHVVHVDEDEGSVIKTDYQLLAETYRYWQNGSLPSLNSLVIHVRNEQLKLEEQASRLRRVFGDGHGIPTDWHLAGVVTTPKALNALLGTTQPPLAEGPSILLPALYYVQPFEEALHTNSDALVHFYHTFTERKASLDLDAYTEANERHLRWRHRRLNFDPELFGTVHPGEDMARILRLLDDPAFRTFLTGFLHKAVDYFDDILDIGGRNNVVFKETEEGWNYYLYDAIPPRRPLYRDGFEAFHLHEVLRGHKLGKLQLGRVLNLVNYTRTVNGLLDAAGSPRAQRGEGYPPIDLSLSGAMICPNDWELLPRRALELFRPR